MFIAASTSNAVRLPVMPRTPTVPATCLRGARVASPPRPLRSKPASVRRASARPRWLRLSRMTREVGRTPHTRPTYSRDQSPREHAARAPCARPSCAKPPSPTASRLTRIPRIRAQLTSRCVVRSALDPERLATGTSAPPRRGSARCRRKRGTSRRVPGRRRTGAAPRGGRYFQRPSVIVG